MVREGDLDDLTPRPRHNFGWGSDATGNHDKNMRLLKGLALRRRCTEEGSVIFRCVVAILSILVYMSGDVCVFSSYHVRGVQLYSTLVDYIIIIIITTS